MPKKARTGEAAAMLAGPFSLWDLSLLNIKQLKENLDARGCKKSGTKAQLVERLEEARRDATLQGQVDSAKLFRDLMWKQKEVHRNRSSLYDPVCHDGEFFSPNKHFMKVAEHALVNCEATLAKCRANLWREAAAMAVVPRLAQREGVPRSPLADLEEEVLKIVLLLVEAPYDAPPPPPNRKCGVAAGGAVGAQ
jgi:hypothetical protein